MELQMLQQQSGQVQQQLQMLSQQKMQIENGMTSIQSLRSGETLLPILQGIFLKVDIKELKGIVVNIGNNVCVEKTKEQTVTMLQKQLDDISQFEQELLQQISKFAEKAKEIEKGLKNVQET